MKSVFLSIIIPCYNVENYLVQTIRSLQNLENSNDVEFIFINDGSKDNTLKIIHDFLQTDSRVILIDQQNQGVSAARNNALEVAKGQYILFLDGDDCLETDTINILKRNRCDALLAPIYTCTGKSKQLLDFQIQEGEYTIEELFQRIYFFPPAPMLIYNGDIIRNHHIRFSNQIKAGEVLDFTFSFFTHANSIQVIHTGFYNYVLRPTSATHLPNVQNDLTSLYLLRHLQQNSNPWRCSKACIYTIYKVINSFMYTKYLRARNIPSNYKSELTLLLHNCEYRRLLKKVCTATHTPLREKLLIVYQLILPPWGGFNILRGILHLISL